MRKLLLLLLLAGCKVPATPTPGVPTAPSISGVYAPAVALDPPIPASAVATSFYTGYPDQYQVALCIDLDGVNLLCYAPPLGSILVSQ